MSTFFRYTSTILIITLVSKGIGFLRDIFLVNKLDIGAGTDTFYAACTIVEFFILISGLNAMKSVATTTFTREHAVESNARRYLSSLVIILFIYGLIISLPSLALPHVIIRISLPGFSTQQVSQTAACLKILAYIILFRGAYLVLGSLLGVKKRFFFQNIFLLIVNGCVVCTILCSPARRVITNVCLTLTVGYACACLLQYLILSDWSFRFTRVPLEAIRSYGTKFARLAFPLLFVTAAFSLAGVVDKAIGSFFEKGIITALTLSNMICFFPINLVLIPISNVLFPQFSRVFHEGNLVQLSRDYNRGQILVAAAVFPLAIFLMVFPTEVTSALFIRKNVSGEHIAVISRFLSIYSMALIFNGIYFLTSFLFQSAQKNMIVGKIGVTAYLLNIVVSIALSLLFGPIGIPIGSLCAFIVLAVLSLYSLGREFGIFLSKETQVLACAVIGLSLLSAFLARWIGTAISLDRFPQNIKHITALGMYAVLYCVILYATGYPLIGKKVVRIVREI